MAQVNVKNTREHAIHVNVKDKDEITTVTFPHAEFNTNALTNRDELTPSNTLVDSSFIDLAKKNTVAAEYFKMGWLKVEADDEDEKPSKDKQRQDQKDSSKGNK